VLLKFSMACLFLVFLNSCGQGSKTSGSNVSVTCADQINPPTYSVDAQSIISSRCVTCHGNYSNYSGASANSSQILSDVSSGRMPPNNSMTSTERDIIEQWVACGSAP
jgi:uncharacterized membrane protein